MPKLHVLRSAVLLMQFLESGVTLKTVAFLLLAAVASRPFVVQCDASAIRVLVTGPTPPVILIIIMLNTACESISIPKGLLLLVQVLAGVNGSTKVPESFGMCGNTTSVSEDVLVISNEW